MVKMGEGTKFIVSPPSPSSAYKPIRRGLRRGGFGVLFFPFPFLAGAGLPFSQPGEASSELRGCFSPILPEHRKNTDGTQPFFSLFPKVSPSATERLSLLPSFLSVIKEEVERP